eukprot:12122822-Prorocentrum_lima.AAC.1
MWRDACRDETPWSPCQWMVPAHHRHSPEGATHRPGQAELPRVLQTGCRSAHLRECFAGVPAPP